VDGAWDFADFTENVTEAKEIGSPLSYHQYILTITSTRKSTFVIIAQIFPLMLLGCVTTLNFFMNPGADTR
jgi:hypothetical protein